MSRGKRFENPNTRLQRRPPLQPAPFLDETLGSWVRRCADAYRTTAYGYIHAIVHPATTLHQDELPDLDTSPPKALMRALCTTSGLAQDELAHLVVQPGPWTLRPSDRDAYCPICMTEDLREGRWYIRRAWLDAWTLVCPRHGCLMAEFKQAGDAPTDVRAAAKPINTVRLFAVPELRKTVAPAPAANVVHLPKMRVAHVAMQFVWNSGISHWLDPLMLSTLVGRDLVMLLGSSSGDYLYKCLYGYSRTWDQTWHDAHGKAFDWGLIHHPIAAIRTRLQAAYMAGVIWQALGGTHDGIPTDNRHLTDAIREGLLFGDGRRITNQIKCRWGTCLPRAVGSFIWILTRV